MRDKCRRGRERFYALHAPQHPLRHAEPVPYTLLQPRAAPVFGPVRDVVDAILAADENAPRKQRHTAKRVFDRLRDECGFTGGYTIIKDYMRERDQL